MAQERPNDIEFSGERKRVRCNEGLDARKSFLRWLDASLEEAASCIHSDGGLGVLRERNDELQICLRAEYS
jgi:hypothetical protein